MGKYANAMIRASEILTLLMSEEYTVNKISEKTGVPVPVLQNDLLHIFADNTVRSALIVGADADNDTHKETWLKSLRCGEKKAFTEKIFIDPDILTGGDKGDALFVNLTPFEKNVFAKTINVSRFSDSVWIKEPAVPEGNSDAKVLGPVQMAIEQNHPISFKYTGKDFEEVNERFCARCIYEVLSTGVRYCVGVREDGSLSFKRMDQISKLTVHEDEQMPPLKEGALDILDYMWGADGGAQIVHVKIKIFKETKNIFEKIKTETNARKYGRLYDDPKDAGVAYYEDDVCGLNSFKKWLRGYGASVVVLEPLSLAEEMYKSAMRKLAHYREVLGR